MTDPILTDGRGVPLERPTPPGPDATSEQVLAYLRASCTYNDRVAALASSAFDCAFRRARRR